jgi:hypothetical protein
MARVLAIFAGICVLAGLAVYALLPDGRESAGDSRSALGTAALAPLPATTPKPEPKPEGPKFDRTMYASTQLAGSAAALDACKGPVAVDVGEEHPVLVVEHDYCGGSAWMPRLQPDDLVRLSGDGVVPGLYRVSALRYSPRYRTRVSDLPGTDIADVVLQTCVSKTSLVLVGLQLVDDVNIAA